MCAVAQRSSEHQGSSELARIPIPRTPVNKASRLSRESARFGAVLERAQVPEDQDQGETHSQDAADEEVPADGSPCHESLIYAKGLHEEAPHRIETHVEQEYVAVL